jgi:hypothetical protein
MDIISDDKQVNQLIKAYHELKDTGINKLIVNYEWTGYAENDLGKKNSKDEFVYNEKEVSDFIQFCPPSICEYKNFTVNFLKLLYAESYVNPNFVRATVSYDGGIYLNSGIGGALKEKIYKL